MTEIQVPSEGNYDEVVPLLKSCNPTFAASSEYKLVADCDDLPGVVLAAYGRFIAQLLKDSPRPTGLDEPVAVINVMREWSNSRVRESIRDEFIESFDGDDDAVRAVRPMLSQNLAADFVKVLNLDRFT